MKTKHAALTGTAILVAAASLVVLRPSVQSSGAVIPPSAQESAVTAIQQVDDAAREAARIEAERSRAAIPQLEAAREEARRLAEEQARQAAEAKARQEAAEAKAREEAAKSVGVNDRYVSDAKKVKAEAPEVFERLKAGKITLQDAKREVKKKPTDDWREDERERRSLVEDEGVTVVANAQADKNLICWAEREGLAVRIDRSTRYGNPFVLNEDGDRDEVCDAYETHYLPNKPSITDRIDAGELAGKVLVCHCYPQRCHGDCLADKANLVAVR